MTKTQEIQDYFALLTEIREAAQIIHDLLPDPDSILDFQDDFESDIYGPPGPIYPADDPDATALLAAYRTITQLAPLLAT